MKVSHGSSNPNALQNSEASKSSKNSGIESAIEGRNAKDISGSASSSPSVRVDLSSRAMDLKKAKELATPDEGVDEAKVAKLQALIESGQYKVDAEAIADRLLDEHSKMPV